MRPPAAGTPRTPSSRRLGTILGVALVALRPSAPRRVALATTRSARATTRSAGVAFSTPSVALAALRPSAPRRVALATARSARATTWSARRGGPMPLAVPAGLLVRQTAPWSIPCEDPRGCPEFASFSHWAAQRGTTRGRTRPSLGLRPVEEVCAEARDVGS